MPPEIDTGGIDCLPESFAIHAQYFGDIVLTRRPGDVPKLSTEKPYSRFDKLQTDAVKV